MVVRRRYGTFDCRVAVAVVAPEPGMSSGASEASYCGARWKWAMAEARLGRFKGSFYTSDLPA